MWRWSSTSFALAPPLGFSTLLLLSIFAGSTWNKWRYGGNKQRYSSRPTGCFRRPSCHPATAYLEQKRLRTSSRSLIWRNPPHIAVGASWQPPKRVKIRLQRLIAACPAMKQSESFVGLQAWRSSSIDHPSRSDFTSSVDLAKQVRFFPSGSACINSARKTFVIGFDLFFGPSAAFSHSLSTFTSPIFFPTTEQLRQS